MMALVSRQLKSSTTTNSVPGKQTHTLQHKEHRSPLVAALEEATRPSLLTGHVDLHLQVAVLGDGHRGPLGDHTALDRLGHDGPGGAGHARVGAGTVLPGLSARALLRRHPQEVPHQLQPVEDEEDPQVVEDHGEAGGVARGPAGRGESVSLTLLYL